MPTSRGSCTGSAILLGLALNGHAPAALIFREPEDILTLGALVAWHLFDSPVPVVHLDATAYDALVQADHAALTPTTLRHGNEATALVPLSTDAVALSAADRAALAGEKGAAPRVAMRLILAMAALQGATSLTRVTRVHIDGCIYASPANLTFARRMADMGARVVVPTTTNAISVDRRDWREQGVPPAFGTPAAALADAYVEMGAAPSFTCAPYLMPDPPAFGEAIAWAESNAVIFANSVLGARTVKHPDFLDLCIALTGRAPLSGVYRDDARRARTVLRVSAPEAADDALWPLLGHVAGLRAPAEIPLIVGLEHVPASPDDLKALCAAFGTTSAAPMLHVAGHTPEAEAAALPGTPEIRVTRADLAADWTALNDGGDRIDLVAIGSPHASAGECRALADLLGGRRVAAGTALVVTCARETLNALQADGTLHALCTAGVRVVPDLCWCSITEPVFPPPARTLMTNSGKYAHYAPGLSGRRVRFGSLAACAEAACTGHATNDLPHWLL